MPQMPVLLQPVQMLTTRTGRSGLAVPVERGRLMVLVGRGEMGAREVALEKGPGVWGRARVSVRWARNNRSIM